MSELISVAQAQDLIARNLPAWGTERVALDQAAGRILRQRVVAERDQPPFDRVMMDGIALRWQEDLSAPITLSGAQLAGMNVQDQPAAGACLEVTTGALLPAGCDCVVPVEQTRREGDSYALAPGYRPERGQYIHSRGSDCRAGSELLQSGVQLGGPALGVLAANGVATVKVARQPAVAIVSTGDELVDVDAPLLPGQIRRSNDRALAGLLQGHGFDRVGMYHVHDDLQATTDALARLLDANAVVILSGGVSMGQRDYVPAALARLGVRQVFHRIAQRPGKPMWFGVGRDQQLVFGLPGNPVSTLVAAARYVVPALRQARGEPATPAPLIELEAATTPHPVLTCFTPVIVDPAQSGRWLARLAPVSTSGDFSSLPHTGGFVQLDPSATVVPAGDRVPLYRW